MIKNFKKRNSGNTILETLFYIALFAALSIAVINSLIVMTKAFKETTIQADLMQGGQIMERISRETRLAYGINSITASSLKLNTTDDAGVNATVTFSLIGTDVQLLKNDVFFGNYQQMNRLQRVNVRKYHQILVFVGKFFRNDSIPDFAKYTISHNFKLFPKWQLTL